MAFVKPSKGNSHLYLVFCIVFSGIKLEVTFKKFGIKLCSPN